MSNDIKDSDATVAETLSDAELEQVAGGLKIPGINSTPANGGELADLSGPRAGDFNIESLDWLADAAAHRS